MFLKAVVGRILVAALTFITGVTLSLPWQRPARTSQQGSALSICESFNERATDGREIVRLRGMLYGNTDGTLVLNELDCGGQSTWIAVSFDKSLAGKDESRRFIDRMRKQSVGETMARVEVIVTGRLRATGSRDARVPQYSLSAVAYEQLTPISVISFVAN